MSGDVSDQTRRNRSIAGRKAAEAKKRRRALDATLAHVAGQMAGAREAMGTVKIGSTAGILDRLVRNMGSAR